MHMTLTQLRDRLNAILRERPEVADVPVILEVPERVPDRRKREGYRTERTFHPVRCACSGTIQFRDGQKWVEIMANERAYPANA